MNQGMRKVAVITGASQGIGEAPCRRVPQARLRGRRDVPVDRNVLGPWGAHGPR